MAIQEILLREDVEKLGRCGDVVKVPAGYARNYLLPRGIAISATAENRKLMDRRRKRLEAEYLARAAEFEALARALSAVHLKTSVNSDEAGHLYGSVSTATISGLLAGAGHEVSESDVCLDDPIKTVGTHRFRVHVHGELYADLVMEVESENVPEAVVASLAAKEAGEEAAPGEAPAGPSETA